MTKVLKPIHAYEQLDLIEKETDEVAKKNLLASFGAKTPLNFILSLNFNDDIKLDLPEGMPPMDNRDMDMQTHPDFMGLLSAGISRVRHCTDKSTLKKMKKEQIFYEILINCPMKDAEILCSAKDSSLVELYPSITAELVKSVFPSYVSEKNEA